METPQRFPASMVLNLAEDRHPNGTHWVALFMLSPFKGSYFDSYGQQPPPSIREFTKTFPDMKVRISDLVIQSIDSDVCATYCIYFLYRCSQGQPFDKILLDLSKKSSMDAYVRDFTYGLIN